MTAQDLEALEVSIKRKEQKSRLKSISYAVLTLTFSLTMILYSGYKASKYLDNIQQYQIQIDSLKDIINSFKLLNKNIVQIDWRVVKPISGYGGKAGEFFHFAMEENTDEHPHFLHSGIGIEN